MNNKEFDYLDLISIMSFIIGLQSLEIAQMNLVENRKQTEDTQKILEKLENHLHTQDLHLANQDKILENITKWEE